MNEKILFLLIFKIILILVYLKTDYHKKPSFLLKNKTTDEKTKNQNLECRSQLENYLSNYNNVKNKIKTNEQKHILDVINKNKINEKTIVTVSNFGFKNLTLNWILSLKAIDINKFVIFSFDQKFIDYLSEKGYKDNVLAIPIEWLNLMVDQTPASFLSTNYYAITQAKTNLVYELLNLNQKFIFSDVDCVWLNKAVLNYVDLIIKNSKAHMIYAQDFGSQDKNQPYYNTGFFYATPTNFTKRLYFMMTKMQEKNKQSVDQFVLDNVLKMINFNDNRLETFDILIIANGDYYFHKKMDNIFKVVPFVVHANYFPSIETKIKALKSRDHWFL